MQKILLVCYVSPEIGLGHLSRLMALAQKLKKDKKVIPEFVIFGELIKKDELENFIVHNFSIDSNFATSIKKLSESNKFSVLIFDIYKNHNINNLYELFTQLKQQSILIISIDTLIEYCDTLDLIWIPSFNFDISKYRHCKSILKSGWDTYLIHKRFKHKEWAPGSKILVLTGGSDPSNLGETLPAKLDQILNKNSEVNWVKGPFSKKPSLPEKIRLNWTIHDAPQQIDRLIVQSSYILTVFGVSFFEALQYGIPTVVFSTDYKKDSEDLNSISKEKVAIVAKNSKSAVKGLSSLMIDHKLAKKISNKALNKMLKNGTQNLSKNIYSLMKI